MPALSSNPQLPRLAPLLLALLLAAGCGSPGAKPEGEQPPPADPTQAGSTVPDVEHCTVRLSRTRGLTANGVDATDAEVTVRNGANEPLAGLAVTVSLGYAREEPSQGDPSVFTGVTDAAGVVRGSLATTTAGLFKIHALVALPNAALGRAHYQSVSSVEFLPGPPTVLKLVNPMYGQVAGAPFSPPLYVSALDAFGNEVLTTPAVTLSLVGGPAGAVLEGPVQTEAAPGMASFSATYLTLAGEGYVLRASSPGLQAAESEPFTVTAAAPVRMAFLREPEDVVAGAPLPDLRVAHYDAYDNLATGAMNFVTLYLLPTRFDVPLYGGSPVGVRSGLADFSGLHIERAGEGYQLQARNDPLPPILSRTFRVRPAAPSAERSTLEASPERVLADGSAASTLVLRARDAFGNPAPDAPVQLQVAQGQGTLALAAERTGASGVATARLSSGQSGRVTVRAQLGGGTLQQEVRFARACALQVGLPGLPNAPLSPALVADFDADGHLDIAGSGYGNVGVARGLGDGTFARPQYFSGYGSPAALATGDLDGDGLLDLVLAGSSHSVLRGQGDGTFGHPSVYSAGASFISPRWVGVADVDADGRQDLLYLDVFESGLGVMLNQGEGRLGPHTVLPAPRPSTSGTSSDQPQLLDLDGDGRLDLLLVDYYGAAVRVLRASATGGFLPVASYALSLEPQDLAAGDVDGDGRLDLLALPSYGAPALLRGQADGTFGAAQPVSTEGIAAGSRLALGDVDGDGDADLAVTQEYPPRVTLLRNDGTGRFVQPTVYAQGQVRGALRFADLTHDARPELLLSNRAVLLNAGDGSLRAPMGQPSSWGAKRLLVADWNADGLLDLATVGAVAGASWGVAGGGFAPYASLSGLTSEDAASGDFDGNGRPELVLARAYDARLDFFQVDASGSFQALPPQPLAWTPAALHAAHLDEDGRLDLAVVSREEHAVRVLHNLGTGAFSVSDPYPAGSEPSGLTSADLDGDGRRDLVVVHENTRDLSVLLAQAAGGYAPAVALAAGGRTRDVAAADLDGDGHLDLAAGVVTASQGAALVVLMGAGDGTFGAPLQLPLAGWPGRVLAADFNGDGHRDLLAVGGTLTLFLGDGDGSFAPTVDYGSGLGVVTAELAHVDGDGRVDVAAALEASSQSQSAVLFNRCLR